MPSKKLPQPWSVHLPDSSLQLVPITSLSDVASSWRFLNTLDDVFDRVGESSIFLFRKQIELNGGCKWTARLNDAMARSRLQTLLVATLGESYAMSRSVMGVSFARSQGISYTVEIWIDSLDPATNATVTCQIQSLLGLSHCEMDLTPLRTDCSTESVAAILNAVKQTSSQLLPSSVLRNTIFIMISIHLSSLSLLERHLII